VKDDAVPANPASPEVLTLLLSVQAAREFGARIADVLRDRPHRLVHLEDPAQPDGSHAVDAAFLTRDVTAGSGKTQLSDALAGFYDILRRSPDLRWLQTHAAGADRPIYAELRQRDVIVTTGSGANARPVAQMAVAGLLALARRLPELMDAQRRRAWEPLLGVRAPRDLDGQTAVVVGLGPIGVQIARLLKALGLHVIGVRRQATPCPWVDETVELASIEQPLQRADWLVLACPLNNATRGLVNARTLALLPASARVINVARGEVVVERDLIPALRSGRLGGAYLDVVEQEPLSEESELWTLPNVIITPHCAGHTAGHYAAVGEIFLDNLARWHRGQPLRNTIA
jgi:phosphoglycerate dehydrogenase-like enzyme